VGRTGQSIGFLGAAAVVQTDLRREPHQQRDRRRRQRHDRELHDLTVYANDAAAIRNDIYQLARKLKQVNDALRPTDF